MEKHISGLLIALSVFSLMFAGISGVVGYNMGNEDNIVETKYIYQNVSVDKIIEILAPSELDRAVAEFLKSVEDEEDEAGNDINILDNYNFDELEVNKIYDIYNIAYDDEITTVDFKIKLKFDDGDDRLREIYNIKVIFDEEEDTEVIVA